MMLLKLRRRLFIFQIFLLLIGACAVAYGALRTFERDLEPDMTRKGDLIARSLAAQIERAVDAGIAFERLHGVEDLLASIRSANSEIVFICVINNERTQAFYDGKPAKGNVVPSMDSLIPTRIQSDGAAIHHQAVRWNEYLVVPKSISVGGKPVGWVLVGIDATYIQQKISDIFYDILVVVAVSLLLTFELLLLLMASASAPTLALQALFTRGSFGELSAQAGAQRWPHEVHRLAIGMKTVVDGLHGKYHHLAASIHRNAADAAARSGLSRAAAALDALERGSEGSGGGTVGQQALVRVRMPLFIFFLAEELSRPFFPIYVRSLYQPIEGISPEIAASLPIMLFMLVVAFSQPLAGPWTARLGARRLMTMGAIVGAIGLLLTAFADSFWQLLAWRFVTAAGYGVVFVAGQSHVVNNTNASNRAWGLAMFVGSVLAASICGPAVGGILADRIGYRWTFVVGANIALLAAFLAWRLLWSPPDGVVASFRPLRLRDVGTVLRNSRFLALVGLGAMPAKIILTGFLYYLAPMYLAELGNSQSAAGRIMMLYGLMMVLMTPLSARVVDRVGRPLLFVILGGVLSGAGLSGILFANSTALILIAIVVLGIAQAVSITPQLALVPVACPEECRTMGQVTVIGFFRLFERIGSALGPILAAFLLHRFGYAPTIATIGCGVGIACLLLGAVWSLCTRLERIRADAHRQIEKSGHVAPSAGSA